MKFITNLISCSLASSTSYCQMPEVLIASTGCAVSSLHVKALNVAIMQPSYSSLHYINFLKLFCFFLIINMGHKFPSYSSIAYFTENILLIYYCFIILLLFNITLHTH